MYTRIFEALRKRVHQPPSRAVGAAFLAIGLVVTITAGVMMRLYLRVDPPSTGTVRAFSFAFVGIFGVMFIVVGFAELTIATTRRRFQAHQVWVLNVINAKLAHIQAQPLIEQTSTTARWPWGSHTTKDLEDMAAAAQRYWTLYEKSDPGTAPTNEMVSDWLRSERGTSKEKARAIASILRADGLPPGPRP